MAEVGTRSSMTSNHELVKVGSSTWPLNHCCSVYSCYRVGPAITFHAVYKQMKCMHKQGVGERSEPHSLYIIIYIYYTYGSTYSRNGSYVPYLFQYRTKSSKDRIAQLARQSSLPWKLQCDRVRGHSIAETLPLSARRTKCSLPVYSTEPAVQKANFKASSKQNHLIHYRSEYRPLQNPLWDISVPTMNNS